MDESSRTERLQADTSVTNEAFQLLSDGTRLEILQALAEAGDPGASEPVRFADLRERIDADDPGRINYHLNKLTTHFVRRTEDGYELREAGKRMIRVLKSGTVADDPEIDPVAVDLNCWFCGGGTELSYREGWRYLECTNCDARCVDTFPPGVISKNAVPPAGLLDRTPNEIADADRVWGAHRRASVMDEVCPECSGNMPVTDVDVCEDHQPDWEDYRYCENCNSIFWMQVSHVCEVCLYTWRLPTLFYPTRHPAVVAFFYNHGIEFDLATGEHRSRLLEFEEEVLSADPLSIRTTIPAGDDELQVTFDEGMNVVDVSGWDDRTAA